MVDWQEAKEKNAKRLVILLSLAICIFPSYYCFMEKTTSCKQFKLAICSFTTCYDYIADAILWNLKVLVLVNSQIENFVGISMLNSTSMHRCTFQCFWKWCAHSIWTKINEKSKFTSQNTARACRSCWKNGQLTITVNRSNNIIYRFRDKFCHGKSILITKFVVRNKDIYERGDAKSCILLHEKTTIQTIAKVCNNHRLSPQTMIQQLVLSLDAYLVGSIATVVITCHQNNI